MKLNKFAKECHKNAKSKGWWEKPRTSSTLLMLIIGEIAEASEEIRGKKPAVYFNTPTGIVTSQDLGGGMNLKVGDVLQKPEGYLIEVADAVIRAGDFAGYEDMDLDHFITTSKYLRTEIPKNHMDAYFEMCQILSNPASSLTEALTDFFAYAEEYCKANELDLWKAVQAKVEYNHTRAHRHGGKAF